MSTDVYTVNLQSAALQTPFLSASWTGRASGFSFLAQKDTSGQLEVRQKASEQAST